MPPLSGECPDGEFPLAVVVFRMEGNSSYGNRNLAASNSSDSAEIDPAVILAVMRTLRERSGEQANTPANSAIKHSAEHFCLHRQLVTSDIAAAVEELRLREYLVNLIRRAQRLTATARWGCQMCFMIHPVSVFSPNGMPVHFPAVSRVERGERRMGKQPSEVKGIRQ